MNRLFDALVWIGRHAPAFAVLLIPVVCLAGDAAAAPGFIATDLTYQNNSPEQIEVLRQGVPMARLGEPKEVAKLVVFLCSDDNSFMTGQAIAIDGGFTIT